MTAQRFELNVEGMSCASCVGHVERALRGVPGVERADVNLVTERATVVADERVTRGALAHAVDAAGYKVAPEKAAAASPPRPSPADTSVRGAADEARSDTRDLVVAAAVTVPLLFLGMEARSSRRRSRRVFASSSSWPEPSSYSVPADASSVRPGTA